MTTTGRRGSESSVGWGRPQRRRSWGSRVLKALVVTVAVLVVLFLAGGGWYFAGQIHADALEVDPWEPQYGQNVVSVGDGTITISDPADEQPVLDGPDVSGLQWRSGYGQVYGPGSSADEVTRDFTLLTGRLPRPDEEVDVDPWAFPVDDPAAALGTEVQDVSFPSELGALPAWFVPGEQDTWAILVHGKGATRAEMLRMMRTTVDAGLPSLAIGYRNDREAESDPSGLYQFGRTEWRDLASAVEHAKDEGARDVVLVGASMGGAIIASYLENVDDAPVRGVVLDSPMLDFGETVSFGASQRTLPLLGTVPAPLTWTTKQIAALRWDVDWDAVDYLDDTSWVTAPTLVVHGDGDLTVPLRTSEELARSVPDLVELAEFKGAGHVAAWNTDPDRYDDLLARFLEDVT